MNDTSPETISIVPVDEGMREHLRAIWSDPRQVEFRAAVLRDPSHVAFLTRGGTDPLPEVAAEDGNSEPLEPPTAVLVEYCSHQCPDAELRCQLATVAAPQTHTHMATDGDGRSWAWLGVPGYGTFEVRGPVDAQRRGRRVIRQGDRTRS